MDTGASVDNRITDTPGTVNQPITDTPGTVNDGITDTAVSVNEWVQVIRRARLGSAAKSVAFALATYADADGSKVFPGIGRLAAECEYGYSTIRKAFRVLRRAGLIERVRQGNRRHHQADEYRLILAPDLLDRVAVLDPIQVQAMARDLVPRTVHHGSPSSDRTRFMDTSSPPITGTGRSTTLHKEETLQERDPPCRSPTEVDSPPAREARRMNASRNGRRPGDCRACGTALDPDGSCFTCRTSARI